VSLLRALGKKPPWDETRTKVMEKAAVTEDEEAEDSSRSCSSTSHLKLSFTHMEVENKAKQSPMLP